MKRYYSPPVIQNEDAYQRAIEARIKANKVKTTRARWYAQFDDADLLTDWLYEIGQFKATQRVDPRCEADTDEDGTVYVVEHWYPTGREKGCTCKRIPHPLSPYARGPFLAKMREALDQWGGLTEGQHLAVRRSYAEAQDKLAGKDARIAEANAEDLKSVHVGTVGERRDWVLKVERVLDFQNDFGWTHFNICKDEDGNVVVYKGSQKWTRGETVSCKATVKLHDDRNGVAQTVIARPKLA